jgi:hypothetical protein
VAIDQRHDLALCRTVEPGGAIDIQSGPLLAAQRSQSWPYHGAEAICGEGATLFVE